MSDVPQRQHRLAARGRRIDDGTLCTLLVIHETNGTWTFHGLGAPGVVLSAVDMVELAMAILERS